VARIATTVVGSYPQPDWLVDKAKFASNAVPRVRRREIWRLPEPLLDEAQDDAVRLAVRDMERAGIDLVTDGEQLSVGARIEARLARGRITARVETRDAKER